MHKYGHDYKLVFVGDATMSPYEVLQPGGSIEYSNDEAGAVWLRRVLEVYPRAVWLNPEPEEIRPYRQSIGILKEIMGVRMYPTTILGLERAMRALVKYRSPCAPSRLPPPCSPFPCSRPTRPR